METRSERVRLGIAEVLDREFPGWLKTIDLERLNIGSHYDCVLGQIHPGHYFGYWNELAERHPSWGHSGTIGWLAAHGFTATDTEDTPDELTETWKQAITALRG